jgi:hypothetical protein
MVLNTMNQLNNKTFYGYIFLLFILGTNQNLSLVFFKNKQITKHIQKTKNNKNATALMYSKFINNLEQTMDFDQTWYILSP